MIARLTVLLSATAALAVLAIGCGSGGNSDSTGSKGNGAEAQSGEKTVTETQSTKANKGGGSRESTATTPSSGAEATGTSSLSKDQFIREASALCNREKNNILAETEAYLTKRSAEGGEPRPVLLADAAKAVLMPVVETRIAGIRKLGAPAGDESEIGEMLAGQEEGIEQVMKLKVFNEGESLVPYFAESNRKFDAYGLTACAYNL